MTMQQQNRRAYLPGRAEPAFAVPKLHTVLGTPLAGPWPEGTATISVAMGCFWGAERVFWQLPGVVTTAVGYQGGVTPNPLYEEVCTAMTGHTETVLVAYDPAVLSETALMQAFWEAHDPTQGDRQGNDVGPQYRSAVFWTTPQQQAAVLATYEAYQGQLTAAGFGPITTEMRDAESAGPFWYAEGYHQQYLAKNPAGYCGIGGTGVSCPMPVMPTA